MKKTHKKFLKDMEFVRGRIEKLHHSDEYMDASMEEILLDLIAENDSDDVLGTLVEAMRNVRVEKRLLKEKESENIRKSSLERVDAFLSSDVHSVAKFLSAENEQEAGITLIKAQIKDLLGQMANNVNPDCDYIEQIQKRIEILEEYYKTKPIPPNTSDKTSDKMPGQPIEVELGEGANLTAMSLDNHADYNKALEKWSRLHEIYRTTEENSFLKTLIDHINEKDTQELEKRLQSIPDKVTGDGIFSQPVTRATRNNLLHVLTGQDTTNFKTANEIEKDARVSSKKDAFLIYLEFQHFLPTASGDNFVTQLHQLIFSTNVLAIYAEELIDVAWHYMTSIFLPEKPLVQDIHKRESELNFLISHNPPVKASWEEIKKQIEEFKETRDKNTEEK